MAKHVLYDVSLTVNGVDLSDHVESVSFVATTNGQAAAAMSEVNDYEMPGTLKLSDPQVTFYQDYASAKVYATLQAAWAARTTFNIVAKPTSSAASATNPQWTIPVFVKTHPVLAASRGDRHMAPVVFGVAGAHSISAP